MISSSGVGERELNWARLEYDDGEPHVTGWVFWSRKDDNPNRPSVSDRGANFFFFFFSVSSSKIMLSFIGRSVSSMH